MYEEERELRLKNAMATLAELSAKYQLRRLNLDEAYALLKKLARKARRKGRRKKRDKKDGSDSDKV